MDISTSNKDRSIYKKRSFVTDSVFLLVKHSSRRIVLFALWWNVAQSQDQQVDDGDGEDEKQWDAVQNAKQEVVIVVLYIERRKGAWRVDGAAAGKAAASGQTPGSADGPAWTSPHLRRRCPFPLLASLHSSITHEYGDADEEEEALQNERGDDET